MEPHYNAQKIMPCPYCSHPAWIKLLQGEGQKRYWILCSNKHCTYSPQTYAATDNLGDAIALWNHAQEIAAPPTGGSAPHR